MMKTAAIVSLVLVTVSAKSKAPPMTPAPRLLDEFATGFMMEDGDMRAAAPECRDSLGWVYYNGHCYMFTRYQVPGNLSPSY